MKQIVHLTAYGPDGALALEEFLPVQVFYEKSHPVLDEAAFRKARQIMRLSGIVYNNEGAVSQQFEVRFDEAGGVLVDAIRPETERDGAVAKPSTD